MDFIDSEFALLISRVLSYSVIGLCVCMKFPQIIALLKSRSTKGVNVRGYWMEIVCYLIGASYGYYLGKHPSTYAETLLLAVQSGTIVFLLIRYGNLWTLENALYAVLVTCFIVSSAFRIIPSAVLRMFVSGALFLAISSKGAQIKEIYKIKSQGSVSILTWSLAAYGCVARLVTVAVEIRDWQIFSNYFISAILNMTIVAMCLYYGKDKKKT